MSDLNRLKKVIEATIFCAESACTIDFLQETVMAKETITKKQIERIIFEITSDYKHRGINLIETGAGYRFVSNPDINEELSALSEERSPRYSRALLETLALIAYQQPITKGDIESIRGVSVANTIMRTLTERDWIKVVGHKEVPGRPALYGTTKSFLEYFNLKSLSELPELQNITYEMLAQSKENENLTLPFDEPAAEEDKTELVEQAEDATEVN